MTALQFVNAILIMLGVFVLVPIAAFCLECIAAALPQRSADDGNNDFNAAPTEDADTAAIAASRPRAAVLIPAHNEQRVIEQTLGSIIPTLATGDRILVVADNCHDQTAELAQRAGAEVVVRTDADHRGKGYALECGLRALERDPPEVLIVVDADCLVTPKTVEVASRLAHRTQRPVQALNLTDRNPASGPIQIVSLLGNHFTNLIRPLGSLRLRAPCRLMGTGMAIPWPLTEGMQFGGDNLVEDMQLGIDLALRGAMPLFCPEARVTSALPADDGAFVSQRTRWEHGHLHTAVTQIPRLLAAGMVRRSWPLLAMAFDLSIPPLTLLVAIWLVGAILSGLAWWFGASGLPMGLLAGGGVAMTAALAIGWALFCRHQAPFRAIVAVPHYMLRKLPIYTGFLLRRQQVWVRTERDSTVVCESASPPVGKGSGARINSH
jgi:cellulose synthase/poly-beta-1,6-N-acetylglucosamine synthase-like glycosyltransferase